MQMLNATVIANGFPTIARSFGQSPLTLNLAIAVYLLAGAVFLPINGWIADRYGARRPSGCEPGQHDQRHGAASGPKPGRRVARRHCARPVGRPRHLAGRAAYNVSRNGAGSLLAVPFFVLSPADAGAEMSGRAGLRAGVPG